MQARDAALRRDRALALDVYAELLERLFSNAVSIGCMGTLFAAFGFLVATRLHDSVLGLLVVAGSVASAAHVALVLSFCRRPRRRDRAVLRRWELRYGAAGFASAMLVGLAGARTFLGGDLGSGMLMTGLIFGYAAGTMARSAVRPWITGPRMVILVASPIVALESRGDLLFAAQGLMLLLFLLTGLETMVSLYRQAVAEIETSLRRNESARRDALTGLANRLSLGELLTERLTADAGQHRRLGVHCLDLDGFKAVNDTHGHPVGDRLLQAVADRLSALVQPDDLVARLGGDEFVVVQADVTDPLLAERLAAEIVMALRAPYRFGDVEIASAASVGVALASRHTRDPAELLAEADAALYVSKSRGRGGYTLRRIPVAGAHEAAPLLRAS